jgi:hypothetical protein
LTGLFAALHKAADRCDASQFGRFSNRPSGSKHFQDVHRSSIDVAHGLALLSGLGTTALPSWNSKTRWNNLLGVLAVNLTAPGLMDGLGFDGLWTAEHHFQREGYEVFPNLIQLGLWTAHWTSRSKV